MIPLPPPIFQVGHLERVPLGTPYPGIVARVGRLLEQLPARTELVIDITGVGKPVFEMFTYAGISPIGVLITAGTTDTRDGSICGVPKLTLVSRLQALLHEGRLKIQKQLPEADTLVRELQDFRVEFTATGHLTFNARSGKHDDLVLGLAIAVWRAYGGGIDAIYEYYRQLATGTKASEPAILSVLTWANPVTRQPWRLCAASIRQGPLRRTRNQTRTMRAVRSSGRKNSGVEPAKLRRNEQTHATGLRGQAQARSALCPLKACGRWDGAGVISLARSAHRKRRDAPSNQRN
jgi:hypothetical protein